MARVFLTRAVVPMAGYGCVLMTQPLGVLYLAAVLRRRGHAVRVLDQRARGVSAEEIARQARDFGADVFGVGGLSVEAGEIERIARAARAALPSAKIVAGGPHPSAAPEDLIATGLFDAVVVGEGEVAFPEAVARMERGEEPGAVQGVATPTTGPVRREEFGEYVEDLDALPMPAWDLVDWDAYRGKLSVDLMFHHPNFAVLFTSRACPYRCTFCHTVFGKVFRGHSPERVLEEMRVLYADYGVREFQFIDDIFNLKLDRAKEICRRIVAWGKKVHLAFPNGLRADDMDDELLDLMQRAGAVRIGYGVETASPRLQRKLEKHCDLDKVFDVIRKTSRRGIFTKASFTVGNPTETEEEILRTIEFARRSDLQMASFSRMTPFKGTRLYDQTKDQLPESLDPATLHFDFSPVNLADVDPARLARLHGYAYRRFYLSWPRVWITFLRFPNKARLLYFALYMARKLFVPQSAEGARGLRPLRARFASAGAP